jgi:hypothetical protein
VEGPIRLLNLERSETTQRRDGHADQQITFVYLQEIGNTGALREQLNPIAEIVRIAAHRSGRSHHEAPSISDGRDELSEPMEAANSGAQDASVSRLALATCRRCRLRRYVKIEVPECMQLSRTGCRSACNGRVLRRDRARTQVASESSCSDIRPRLRRRFEDAQQRRFSAAVE